MDEQTNELKKKILEKKELRGIPSDFLDKYISEYKQKNKKEFAILEEKKYNDKSKEFDNLKKAIRKKLREVHGVFAKEPLGKEKKEKLIYELKKASSIDEEMIINKILESHQSTFERINYYEELYKKIFEDISDKKIIKIIDLGCGYNPFSYHFIEQTTEKQTKNKPKYVAVDINKEDAEFLNKYFEIKEIDGEALTLDLTDEKAIEKIKEKSKGTTVCFAFKLLDSLESKKRGASEQLINNISSEKIVVSFPLKTISGKNQIKGQRRWFEKIKNKELFQTEEFVLGSEKYYVLKRNNS